VRWRIFWAITLPVLSLSVVWRPILWLFFNPGRLPIAEVRDVWETSAVFTIVFTFSIWFNIIRNAYPMLIEKLSAAIMTVLYVCNIPLTYALAYIYLGVIDGDKEVRNPMTCLYFSIVTWTTLGYGDVRPTANARMVAASEAVLGYLFIGVYVGILSVLFRQIFGNGVAQPSISGEAKASGNQPPT
jgi:hypothetical protein